MPNTASHRLVISVRPGRVATLVADEDIWRPKAMRMLENYSRKWGGAGDILAPVVWKSVPAPFWTLLADFDSDWFAFYVPTYRGRQMADPADFDKWLNETSAKSATTTISAAEVKKMLQDDLAAPLSSWPHDGEIDREIKRRLAPIHRLDLVVGQRFRADGEVDTPLTGRWQWGTRQAMGNSPQQHEAECLVHLWRWGRVELPVQGP